MKQNDIVIFGAGALAQVVHALLRDDATINVAGFAVDRAYARTPDFEGLPLVPFDEIAKRFPPDRYDLLLAIGQTDRNRARGRAFATAEKLGYRIRSYIDPTVRRHASVRIGRGCLIFDGVSLQPFAQIGDNVVIRPLAYIGHHAVIESHAFVAPHAALLGQSRIGAFAFIGAHATVSSRVRVGAGSIVGAGSVVLDDIPARTVVRPASKALKSKRD